MVSMGHIRRRVTQKQRSLARSSSCCRMDVNEDKMSENGSFRLNVKEVKMSEIDSKVHIT